MSYVDVYYSRINHLGDTTAERIRSGGIRSFEKWLAESPHTIQDLSVERGLYFSGIILRNKDKEYSKIMFLNVANDIPLKVGDIMNWKLDDGAIEKWLILQEEKKVNGTYRTFWIIRCNYLLKWIDGQGHLQQSWAYVVSSVDSKIKGNYRTWNDLITPQPNKYAEIVMPYYPIDRATNFIVQDESWAAIECDFTSVPGTIYISLTENKVNMIYDDLVNDIADTDKLAQYDLLLPAADLTFSINDTIAPVFTFTKNGIPLDAELELLSEDKSKVREIDGVLKAVGSGEVNLIVRMKEYPQIQKVIKININNEEQVFSAYIDGPASIRLDRKALYTLKGTSAVEGQVTFDIDNKVLASIYETEDNKCVLLANDKNKLGDIELSAVYGGKTYTKNISIIPLW